MNEIELALIASQVLWFCIVFALVWRVTWIDRELGEHRDGHDHDLNEKAVETIRKYIDEENRMVFAPMFERLSFAEKRLEDISGEELPEVLNQRLTLEEFHEREQRGTLPPGGFVVFFDDYTEEEE